jgi:hypothetical protein
VHRTIKVKNLVRRTRADKIAEQNCRESRGSAQRLFNLLATYGTYPDSRTCSASRNWQKTFANNTLDGMAA